MILVNGKTIDVISVMDRGLAYGDGLFETIAVKQGKTLLWDLHWQRLEAGCKRLNIDCPEADLVQQELQQLLGRASVSHKQQCVIKIVLTRGTGTRGYRIGPGMKTTRILLLGDWPDYHQHYYTEGVKCRICSTRLSLQPLLAGIKHLNRLDQVLARMEWVDMGIAEGIMLDSNDRIIEGTMSNIFFVTEAGKLETPRLTDCGIEGVQKKNIIGLAHSRNMVLEEKDIGVNELGNYREAFLSNSLIGIWPVRSIDEHIYNPGSITRSLQGALEI